MSHNVMSDLPSDNPNPVNLNPLIFSCKNCRTIVGDSYSFVTSNEYRQTITLSAANNVKRSDVVHTSKVGFDIGATYFSFNCVNCPQTLGRYTMYITPDFYLFICEYILLYFHFIHEYNFEI